MSKLNKIIIIVFGLLIVVGGIAVFLTFTNNKQTNTNTLKIPTQQGTVNVQDFTRHPVTTTPDAIVIDQNSSFQILNYKSDNSFLITLFTQPLKQARTDAENVLLKNLNITQAEACSLNVSVKTPNNVNTTYSGKELGMDFCQNAVLLP